MPLARLRLAALSLATTALLSSCARFETLKADISDWSQSSRIVAQLDGDAATVDGAYTGVWTQNEDGSLQIQDIARSPADGRVAFLLKDNTDYFIGGFKDQNDNAAIDDGEPVWFYGETSPEPIPHATRDISAMEFISIPQKSAADPDLLAALRLSRGDRSLEDLNTQQSIDIVLGDRATLDDPRFAIEVGDQGLWEPTHFARSHGIGVFFLHDYDPEKLPLLMINGASGTPRNWSWIAANIDTERYQLWVYHYPSGLSLEDSANILAKVCRGMQAKYGFEEIGVVAHSMGGLLARRYVQIAATADYEISGLATLSTPWDGHLMAKYGVEYAPAAVPSWRDIATGSAFLDALFETSLPAPHLLIYGDRAKRSPFLPKENDGTVSVESMTIPRAFDAASQTLRLPRNHIDILKAPKALKRIEAFFANDAAPSPQKQ